MERKQISLIKKESGQSLVEMALVLPVLLIILLGIIEFGRVGHCYLTLHYAAREGARTGITGSSDQVIRERIEDALTILNKDEVTITLLPDQNNRFSGQQLTVILDYSITLYMPLINIVLPNPLPLQGKSIMRLE